MPESSASEKTEAPTPERIRKSREQGQLPESQEVPSAMMLGLMLAVLIFSSSMIYEWSCEQMEKGLSLRFAGGITSESFLVILNSAGFSTLMALAPFMLTAMVASISGSVLVGGLAYCPKALKWDVSRMSPVKGMKNLMSMRSVVKLLISLAKLALLGIIAWQYLKNNSQSFALLLWESPAGILSETALLIAGLVGRICIAMVCIAGIDLLYQKWNYTRRLRMSKQEVKEERKEQEVSPEVRRRLRAMQRNIIRKRAVLDVPTADVVIVNPAHYAVAIRYDSANMDAPMMVAKGVDLLCERIKEIARENDVPIVERPPLARALYAAAEPGEMIPETLYFAVAEVLAMIYRMRKKKR